LLAVEVQQEIQARHLLLLVDWVALAAALVHLAVLCNLQEMVLLGKEITEALTQILPPTLNLHTQQAAAAGQAQ
jgi:hypothetical protein